MSIFSAAQMQAAAGAIHAQKVTADKRTQRAKPVRPDGKLREEDEVVLIVQMAESDAAMHSTKREHDQDNAQEQAARQEALDEKGAERAKPRPRLDVQG